MTLLGARAVLYQTIWRDLQLVRGHGFAHNCFWITKAFCIQLIVFSQTLKYGQSTVKLPAGSFSFRVLKNKKTMINE